MTWLFLKAMDVWLFRDGRPFSPGTNQRAECLFPPYPTVVQGAVRSKYLTSQGVDLSEPQAIRAKAGAPLDYRAGATLILGGLELRGPFLGYLQADGSTQLFFPQPGDAYSVDTSKHTLRPASAPTPAPGTVKSGGADEEYLLGFSDPPIKGETGLWLEFEALISYLNGNEAQAIPGSALYDRESRTGIGRLAERGVVEEGLLYEVEFIRPLENAGLFIQVEGYPGFPKRGLLQLGGENRAASFQEAAAPAWPAAPDPLPKRFKVYFATPAYFSEGWKPSSWERYFTGDSVTLRAAALSRYESIGGFDWAIQGHKPALRYVPAGSVYYFETKGLTHLNSQLTQNAITDFGAQIGFGQIIIPAKEW